MHFRREQQRYVQLPFHQTTRSWQYVPLIESFCFLMNMARSVTNFPSNQQIPRYLVLTMMSLIWKIWGLRMFLILYLFTYVFFVCYKCSLFIMWLCLIVRKFLNGTVSVTVRSACSLAGLSANTCLSPFPFSVFLSLCLPLLQSVFLSQSVRLYCSFSHFKIYCMIISICYFVVPWWIMTAMWLTPVIMKLPDNNCVC